ncbi:hypothetical protein IQ07DRAFT_591033 [Pyrenochaeta sp. DS3sAY3a]|nr:hypothetical protein IQ07DRAFT_591033 [Pyrenochaeta sp. DS3sAY3a]
MMPVDPTNVAGLALSSTSLLGQLFGGSIKVLEKFRKAENLGSDAIELQIELGFARARLEDWGSRWGLEEGQHMKHERFKKYGQVAMNHLAYINYVLLELSNLQPDFPTIAAAGKYSSTSDVSLWRLNNKGGVSQQELEALRDKIKQLEVEVLVREKIRWALEDREALRKIGKIKSMIMDLFLQFPPPEDDPVAELTKNKNLQLNDQKSLDAAAKIVSSDTLLSSLILLKIERLKLEQRAMNLKSQNPDVDGNSLTTESGITARRLGLFKHRERAPRPVPVLVEIREVLNNANTDNINRRIRNTARLLSMEEKPAELRTLHCLGVISTEEDTTTTHKMIYKLPATEFYTLGDVLSKGKSKEAALVIPLGKKFVCARVLCRALLYLHLAGWVHKGIRSNNVIFSADSLNAIDFGQPFLCNFEYSRLATAIQDTEDVDGDELNNAYRHPKAQGLPFDRPGVGEYQMAYDVYALGMVLLEIGHHRSIEGLRQKFTKEKQKTLGTEWAWDADRFRLWLLESEVPQLISRVGDIYAGVVTQCLSGLQAVGDQTFQETFLLDVVQKIDLCRA